MGPSDYGASEPHCQAEAKSLSSPKKHPVAATRPSNAGIADMNDTIDSRSHEYIAQMLK